MFVIVSGLDEVNAAHPELPIEQRFRKVMEISGVSITVTSVTDLLAFSLGSVSSIPAIRSFCLFAGISITCDYLLQITFFLACLRLTEGAAQAGRSCLAPCVESKVGPLKGSASMIERCSGLIERGYEAAYRRPAFKAAVAVAFAAYLGYSAWGTTELAEGLPWQNLAPDDSYLQDFFAVRDQDFQPQLGETSHVYFLGDPADPAAQRRIFEGLEKVKAMGCVSAEQTGTKNWLSHLTLAAKAQQEAGGGPALLDADGRILAERFYDVLDAVQALPQWEAYGNHIVRAGRTAGRITASRVPLVHSANADFQKSSFRRTCLNEVHQVNEAFRAEQGPDAAPFVYSYPYVFWEQQRVLLNECLLNLGLAAVGVTLISFLLLGSWSATAVVVLSVLLVDVFLFGLMYMDGIRFNSISVVNLVMAVGLSVDYTLHLVHRFLHSDAEGRAERTKDALVSIGPAVLVGGFSTFAGVLPMTGANSIIFRTFMKLMFGTVLFGLAVGLVLVPTLLAAMGPLPQRRVRAGK